MHPAKWAFRHHEDEPPTSEVDIHKTLGEDLYVVLNGYDTEAGLREPQGRDQPARRLDLARLHAAHRRHRDRVPARSRLRAGVGGGQVRQVEGGGGDWRSCSCCWPSSNVRAQRRCSAPAASCTCRATSTSACSSASSSACAAPARTRSTSAAPTVRLRAGPALRGAADPRRRQSDEDVLNASSSPSTAKRRCAFRSTPATAAWCGCCRWRRCSARRGCW